MSKCILKLNAAVIKPKLDNHLLNNLLPHDEDIWFEAFTGAPQAASVLGLGMGGAPHPELVPSGPPLGVGPQPIEPLVSSPPPKSPMRALRDPQPVPRSSKK